MSEDYENLPSVMKGRDQWICWREEMRDGDVTKVPVDASGGFASTTDSSTWSSFDTAREAHEGDKIDTNGLGFVFDEGSTLMGVDLDDCRDPETGEPTDEAQQIIDDLDSWTEVSPSGTGYHVIVQGFVPDGGNRGDIDDVSHLEMYDKSRYFTVTGDHVEGTPASVETRPSVVKELHSEYVADDDENDDAPGREPNTDVSLDDSELIEKAKSAKNGDEFERLWRGDTSGHQNDHSRADLALCSKLAFWTGGDKQRVDSLFRQSGLMRGKWDEDRGDQTYGEMTVEKAVSGQSDYYEPSSSGWSALSDGGAEAASPSTYVTPDPSAPTLTTERFLVIAGLIPEDGDEIADLNDRQKAAHVWTLIKNSTEAHIRVNRDNDSIWAFDEETGTWSDDGERVLRHVARKVLLAENYGGNVLEELKNQARADPTIELWGDVFGLEAGKIAVKNGLLDLSSAAAGESPLRDLEPEDYALTRLPVEYDPDADGTEWRSFVDDVVEDDMVNAVQEYIGYCLHREPTFDRSLLLVGGGANGKSTFLNVIQEFLGSEDNTTNVSPYDFGDKPSMAELHGALANISADLAGGSLQGKNLGNFKKLTGGDSVTAKKLYQDPFKFTFDGGMLFATNEVPDVPVSDDDAAFWRRWIIVHFDNYFPEGSSKRDPTLEGRLKEAENLSAVLNWAVEGWARLMDQSSFTGVSATPDETRRKWQKWGDSIDEFLSAVVKRDEDAENISTGEAFQVYRAWCRVNDRDAVGRQTFTSRAKDAESDLGYKTSVRTKRSSTPVRGYKAFGTTDVFPDPMSILSKDEDGGDDEDDDTAGTGLQDFDGVDHGDDGDESDEDSDQDDASDGGDGDNETTEDADGGEDGEEDTSLQGEPLGAPITHYVRQNDDGGGVAREELVGYLRDQGAAEKAIDHWIDKLLEESEIGQRDDDKFTV